MKIVADLSLYPLKDGPVPEIISFIKEIRQRPDIEIVTNQLSTQLRGDYESVTGAINDCMRRVMEASSNTVVLVVKYLNVDLEIGRTPSLTPER
jgi:uncharacterized protein YqgV (UPF0045/DUF77 family)